MAHETTQAIQLSYILLGFNQNMPITPSSDPGF